MSVGLLLLTIIKEERPQTVELGEMHRAQKVNAAHWPTERPHTTSQLMLSVLCFGVSATV